VGVIQFFHPPLNPLPSREGNKKWEILPSPHSGEFAEEKREGILDA